MTTSDSTEVANFSLVKGGPCYRLMLRLGLIVGDSYARMAVFFSLLTWLPLLILSAWEGMAMGNRVSIPFLCDFAAYARFLVSLPLLIVADTFVDPKLGNVLRHFRDSHLVTPDDHPRFNSAVQETTRLRDALRPELLIAAIAILHVCLGLSRGGWISTYMSTWYVAATPSGGTLTPAGQWFAASLAIFFFFLYRWVWRLMVWAGLLWKISQLNLQVVPTHPDSAGGLSFVGKGLIRFGYVVFAASAVGAGVCANSILYEGQTLYSLRGPIAVFAALLAAVFLSPVSCFVPTLLQAKRKGLLDYGAFAMKYMQSFDRKWVKGEVLEQEALLGSPDIQALADLDNSFQIIRKMRVVPLDRKTAFTILATAVVPFLPLLLTVFSLEELVREALKMLL